MPCCPSPGRCSRSRPTASWCPMHTVTSPPAAAGGGAAAYPEGGRLRVGRPRQRQPRAEPCHRRPRVQALCRPAAAGAGARRRRAACPGWPLDPRLEHLDSVLLTTGSKVKKTKSIAGCWLKGSEWVQQNPEPSGASAVRLTLADAGRCRLGASAQVVTANPEVRKMELTPDDEFIVLACDGIWDVLSSQARSPCGGARSRCLSLLCFLFRFLFRFQPSRSA